MVQIQNDFFEIKKLPVYNSVRRIIISFYKVISEFYDDIFPFSEKKRSFFRTLVTGSGGSILDIGCATGDLAFFAESIGFAAVGIDNDPDLLRLAEGKRDRKGSSAMFENVDMKRVGEIFRSDRFDIITCMGNTIAHLGSLSEITGFFRSIYELLDEGGVFAGQLVNYEREVSSGSGSFNEIENKDFRFVRKNRVNEVKGKVEFSGELTLKNDGSTHLSKLELYPVTKDLVEKELNDVGFQSIIFFGGFDLGKYENQSGALIFRAEK